MSKNVLYSLLEKNISENENSKFSYDDFKNQYEDIFYKLLQDGNWSLEKIVDITYENVKNSYLKFYCPPIKYCGEGSSRAAFACLGGQCLKIAKNKKGVAQNKQEIKNLKTDEELICFSKIYDYDESGSSLMTECCSKALDSDFDKAYDIRGGTYTVYSFLRSGVIFKFDIQKTLDYYISRVNDLKDSIGSDEALKAKYGSDTEAMNKAIIRTENNIKDLQKEADFMKKVQNDKGPQWQVIRDIFSFYSKHNVDELALDDLQNPDNWGLAIRQNKVVPVIIDAGLSFNIYQQFYQKV